jgi:biopolymer transport protein ExbD
MFTRFRPLVLVLAALVLPALLQAQEDVEIPLAPDSISRAGNAIVLMLPAAGGYEINHQKIELVDIGQQLRAIYGARPVKILLISWGANRPWKEVASVVLLVQEEGVTVYRLTALPNGS